MQLEDIVKFGSSKGFKFSLEGLESYLESEEEDFNKKLDNDEIPEEILEEISGGSADYCTCRMVRSFFRGIC